MYLWVLDRQELPPHTVLDDGPVVAELTVSNPESVAERVAASTSMEVIGVENDAVTVLAGSDATINGAPEDRHLVASFVIDYGEASVAGLLEDIAVVHDESPSPDELREYVFRHVSETRYSRGFDLASRVAATGEGDCTEHAVLLTALARAVGYPSRVVFGVLLMEQDNKVQSFGHAWSELYVDGAWRVLDSTTGVNIEDAWLRYVPLLELTEEGPGFGRELLNLMAVLPSDVHLKSDEAVR